MRNSCRVGISGHVIKHFWIHSYIKWGECRYNLGASNLKLDEIDIEELPPANESFFKAIGVVRGSG